MKKENVAWLQHEALELVKQASAVVVAVVTLGGFIVTFWSYLGLWVPVSTSTHNGDISAIRTTINSSYNQLKRMTLANRIETLQMRVTNLAAEIHNIEDGIAVHTRALANPQVSEQDKEISKRRIVILQDLLKWTTERQRLVHIQIGKVRSAMIKLPYDPQLGDIEELRDAD